MSKKKGATGRPQYSIQEDQESPAWKAFSRSRAFVSTFSDLCREHDLPYAPEVVPRPKPRCLTEPRDRKGKTKIKRSDGHGKSHKGKTHKVSVVVEPEPLPTLQPMTVEVGPVTFSTKDYLEYFRPCVQVSVETENGDDGDVTEMYIRGWKVDEAMMEVFHQCWTVLPKLHTVNMWNVALDTPTFRLMTSFLPLCARLNTLVLDGNTLADMPLSLLLGPDTRLRHLSLRFCHVTDDEARELARGLGTCSTSNQTLLQLNLSNNHIQDVGAGYLAEALKTNRTLLALNLASNQLTDSGLCALAEAVTWFWLTPEQELARKKMIHEILHTPTQPPVSDSISERPQAVPTPVPVVPDTPEPKKKEKKLNAREDIRTKKGSPHKTSESSSSRKLSDGSSSRRRDRGKVVVPSPSPEEPPKAPTPTPVSSTPYRPFWYTVHCIPMEPFGSHPFLQGGYVLHDRLWVPGNLALASLNVSNNKIGMDGLKALLQAVWEQMLPSCGPGRGLLRVVLHRNVLPMDCFEMQRLRTVLKLRDPNFFLPHIDLRKASVLPCALPVLL